MRLSPAQLSALLEGLDWSRVARSPCRVAHSDAVIHVQAARGHWRTCHQIGDSAGMTLSIDELPDNVASLKALLLAKCAENARIDAERLDHIVSVLRRAQFGRRSERIRQQAPCRTADADTPSHRSARLAR